MTKHRRKQTVTQWLNKQSRRFGNPRDTQKRLRETRDLVRGLRSRILALKDDVNRAAQPNRALYWENRRLQVALRGSHCEGETEEQCIARLRDHERFEKEVKFNRDWRKLDDARNEGWEEEYWAQRRQETKQ